MEWDTVIGLEVHAQLQTQSKLFSGASTLFGATPNSQTSFIDAGYPGVLPVLNQEAVTMAIRLGIALNATINDRSIFERKNYFYPDLPKGYQISQFQHPIVSHGTLTIKLDNGQEKQVLIDRAHLEEDAGKSLHDAHARYTGVDLNRAGTPLLEIVTAPCLYSIEETIKYLKTLHQLVRFLGICDGNMQEGSFRCDVNLSLKPQGSNKLGIRTELKNLNSFRFIEKAITYEQARHQDVLESGGQLRQETRLFNPDTNTTYVMRDKEHENDYRYFPDPDLLPISISEEQINEIRNTMPELPTQIEQQLKALADLNQEDINFILSSPDAFSFYKKVKSSCLNSDKVIINWLKGPCAAALNENHLNFENAPITAETMATLLNKLHDKSLSANNAKQVFSLLWSGENNIDLIIQRESFAATSEDTGQLESQIKELIAQYPEQAAEYRAGKEKLLGFFVGHMMKLTKGKANPETVNALLKQYLANP
jgi:aspartyl-tRNA(Asn)/glutamyl-tRNA(Gln) amidotransferase subunit B